jgi:GNAT superfamily N-acetyltransferase
LRLFDQCQQDVLGIDLVMTVALDDLSSPLSGFLGALGKTIKSHHMHGMPVSGLVWEESGQIVGNLSLIPIQHWHKRIILVANVAVHPDFRGRGIARTLTATALSYIDQRGVDAAWLQVRDDNPSAIHIYQTLGFEERARRTQWLCSENLPSAPSQKDLILGKRKPAHWTEQVRWLKRLYPEELCWNLPLPWRVFQPGLWGGLVRFFSFEYPTHWVAQRASRLLAVLTSLQSESQTNTLYLAAPPEDELDGQAVQALLVFALRRSNFSRPFALNLPAGYAAEGVGAAGFQAQQTLIWMEFRYHRV